MKVHLCLLSALASFSSNIYANEDYQAYIVNGSDASVTTFPSYAALYVDLIDYNNTYYQGSYCGSTMLDATHILTAAHCVYSTDHDNHLYSLFTVVVPHPQYESYFPYNVTEKQRVSKIYYPDDYDNNTLNNDLAILELESTLTTVGSSDFAVRPTVATGIDTNYRNSGSAFYAVGHGNTQKDADTKDYLQQASLTYVDNSVCGYNNITDKKLCMKGAVSPDNGLETSTCQGDSGGPLYWYNSSEYVQVGLTSFGPATFCGDASYSATSVFTEIYDYRTWIDNVLAGNETPKFVASETKRQAYLASTSTQTASSDDSGGGSVNLFVVFALACLGFIRSRLSGEIVTRS